jgi:hypothetical protein
MSKIKKPVTSVAGKPGFSPVLPKVPLTLGEHDFNLVFNFNALALLEEKTGMNAFRVVDFQNINATTIRAMLWTALITEQPDITMEDVGNLLTFENMSVVYSALLQAWTGSRPEPKKDDEEENPPQAEE